MKKTHILILLPDLRGGGAEQLHVHLANYWNSQGIKVDFALMASQGDLLKLLPESIGIIDLGARRIRDVLMPLSRHLRQTKPDIIIAAMWPLTSVTVIAWLLAGRPGRLFLSDHSQLSISCIQELHISSLVLGCIMHLTYPFATGVIAVSEGVKQDMCRISGLAPSSIRVIYNPAAIGMPSHREPEEVRSQLWGKGFSYHILSVGTLKAQKDHATLIKAFSQLPKDINAKLAILGEGPLRSELETLVQQLGLQDRVTMPGYVLDPYFWYRSADLFVLSSRWEGFGNVIVEALECGVPVVSTDCPSGPAEILENGRFGKLVPIQQPDELAVSIAQCLIKPVDRDLLMRRAKDFLINTIADKYLAYFNLPKVSSSN